MAGAQVVHGRARALVGHVHQRNARTPLQQLDGQVGHRAVAGKGYAHRLGALFGGRHQFGQAAVGGIGLHRDHHGLRGDQGHRRQVLERVEGHPGVQGGVDGHVRRLPDADGVAVGRCLGYGVQADVACRARAVFHHHHPARGQGDLFGHQAAQEVGAAAGREGHHQPDGALWPGIRGLGHGGQRQQGSGGRSGEQGASMDQGVSPVYGSGRADSVAPKPFPSIG